MRAKNMIYDKSNDKGDEFEDGDGEDDVDDLDLNLAMCC